MKPDFKQFEKVLRREIPSRPVLFEFFLNQRLYKRALGDKYNEKGMLNYINSISGAMAHYGYDCAAVMGADFGFYRKTKHAGKAASTSLNEGCGTITDRASFGTYKWRNPADCDYSALENCTLAKGFKLCIHSPDGVLENVIGLTGFDNLCMMLYDDEQLVWDIFENVGKGLVGYYKECVKKKSVGAIISNDDWGFNSATMLSPAHMRKFVFPWHKKIVETAHAAGKPVILHSCGNFRDILDDLIALKYDARHSYEDKIMPVEEAYPLLRKHMAVLGGIDVNWLISASDEEIRKRALNLINEGMKYGGYALGSGNSIPNYVPDEKYLAMIGAANRRNYENQKR